MSDELKQEENPEEIVKEESKIQKKKKVLTEEEKKKRKKKIIIGIIILCVLIITTIMISIKVIRNQSSSEFMIKKIEKKSKNNYVNNNETFIVETEKGSLEEVEKHLYIEPAVNYKVTKLSKNKYEVKAKDIPSDTIVNLIYMNHEVAEDKWAFQSTKDLTVTSIYPADNTSNISTNSTIEIVLSYPNVDNMKDSIVIDPPVEGEFVQNGRIWTLKPTKPLAENTTYTITVKDTLKNDTRKLKETYKSTFSTYQSPSTDKLKYDSITIDNIATFKTTDNPMFITKGDIKRVEMLKFNSSEDFRKYIENEIDYQTTTLGDVDYTKLNDHLYRINQTYEKGYYLEKAYLESGELYFQIPVQINDLQAYLLSTEKDVLVWTGSNNTLLKDIKVEYENSNTKTDEEGLAVIKNYNDKKEKIKYVKIGDDNPLYVGLTNKDHSQLPTAYVYTDRPLYKNTDDINIFGYIPLKYFEEDYKKEDFVLSIEDEKIPIEITDDGTFTANYHLDNYKDGGIILKLVWKDKYIGSRAVTVQKYEKEMYNFTIDMDKNYVEAGSNFNFKVTVEHISGVRVPNKEIEAVVGNDVYKATTDISGEATFSIPTARNAQETTLNHGVSVRIKSTLTESSQKGYSLYFYVIDRNITISNTNYSSKEKLYTAEVYNISTSKDIKTINYNTNQLKDTPYQGTVTVELKEHIYTRKIKEYKYNEITKENVPIYEYTNTDSIVKTDSYNINTGKINYKVDYDFKKSSKEVSYSYEVIFTLTDKNGIITKHNGYIRNSDNEGSKTGYYRWNSYAQSESYNLYTYYLQSEEKQYSVNDEIARELYSYTGEKEIENNKILLVKYKNSILGKKVVSKTENIKTVFEDNNRPGVNITGAYLKEGNFYRLPAEYIDYKEDDSKLEIKIDPNRKTYKPGDEVEVSLKVTKKEKGIKSKVNISVVDEGVFKTVNDYSNILQTLYYNKNYYQYLYSTYRDYALYTNDGGRGSTSGDERADFGDTVFFKTIDTDNDGNAKVNFKLNDSITSFRITVHATTNDVDAGVNHTNIESTIPVSISFQEPRGLKTTDDVVLNAIGIGSTNEDIEYEFSIEGVKDKITKQAKISKTVYANFGKLKAGNYKATIKAKTSDSTDAVKYDFTVGESQAEIHVKNTSSIRELKSIKPLKNPIKLEFYRSSYKKYEKYLNILKKTNEDRLDTLFTYHKALEYENKYNQTKNNSELVDIDKFKTSQGYKYLPGDQATSFELTAILAYYDTDLRLDKDIYYKMLHSDDIRTRIDAYMVLAAMKEPILDDLNADTNLRSYPAQLALAYVFLGDYTKARELVSNSNDELTTYLSTFINKEKASKNIDKLYKENPSSRYLYFSMISYFENNSVDLDSEEEVTVSYGKKKDSLKITPLGKKNLTVYQKDLKELKINSKYKDIYLNYYYEGTLDEVEKENKVENILISVPSNEIKLGDTVDLTIDVTNISDFSVIDIFLPNGLRLSNNVKVESSLVSSTTDRVKIILGEKKTNTITIPLYASSPGNYKIEPIILEKNDKYQYSNTIELTINE